MGFGVGAHGRAPLHSVLLFLVMLVIVLPTTAQEATPEATAEAGDAEGVVSAEECAVLAPELGIAQDTGFLIGQGSVAFHQGNYARAIQAYSCALRLDPGYAPGYVRRGFAYAAQVDYERALADYSRALQLDETLVSAYINRGVLYVAQGNFGLALTDFDLAAALDPANPAALTNRALVHAIEGRPDAALADLEQALILDAAYAPAYAAQGAVYSALAAASYQRFREVSARRLPAGEPDDVLLAVADSRQTGNFGIWLPLFVAAGE